jgi:hypothetical protein
MVVHARKPMIAMTLDHGIDTCCMRRHCWSGRQRPELRLLRVMQANTTIRFKMGKHWIPDGVLSQTPWYRNLWENVAMVQLDHRVLAISTVAAYGFVYGKERSLTVAMTDGTGGLKKKQKPGVPIVHDGVWKQLNVPKSFPSVADGVVCGLCRAPVDVRAVLASRKEINGVKYHCDKSPSQFVAGGGVLST